MEIDYQLRWPLPLAIRLTVKGFTVLLGASGAGKTSLLKALAGLIPATGTPFAGLPVAKRPVSYLPQHYALFPHLSAWRNVAFGLAHLPRSERERRSRQLLAQLGLGTYADQWPRQLSGGQQQRVALARALAREPQLLLLDEPTNALDAATREEVMREVVAIIHDIGVLTLAVSHDPALAQQSDRVAVLAEGRIIQQGEMAEVFTRPQTLGVAQLVGFKNLFAGRVAELAPPWATIDTQAGPLRARAVPWLSVGQTLTWGVRPEEVIIVRADRPLSRPVADNRLSGRLSRLARQGLYWHLTFEGPLRFEILLPRHVQDRLALTEGQALEVAIKPDYLHLIPSSA